jgi:error-prone DNA polymerase
MIDGMLANGYARDFAERCFQQIEGFGEYGFPENHAASFALLVYASAWLKCRYPDAFAAALLNAQPMGFYAPAQIVRDAREHGVEVRPPDINHSHWDSTLESGPLAAGCLHELHRDMRDDIRTTHAMRLGLREIKGLKEEDGRLIVAKRAFPGRSAAHRKSDISDLRPAINCRTSRKRDVRCDALQTRDLNDDQHMERSRISDAALRAAPHPGHEPELSYDSVRDVWLRSGLSPRVLERLADADAFGSLGLTRREALWAAKALGRVGDRDDDLPLFAIDGSVAPAYIISREPDVRLPPMPIGEEVINDYRFLHLSLRAHPAQFLRSDLSARGIKQNVTLRRTASGARTHISGLVTCRQRPGSANGVVFMTIEDETAIANVIVWPKVFERLRPVVLGARYIAVTGRVQEESGVIHVVAEQLEDLTPFLARLAEHGAEIDGLARCDEVRRPIEDQREARLAGSRQSRLVRLMREMPELAGDLDVSARGSAHAPTRRATAALLRRAPH